MQLTFENLRRPVQHLLWGYVAISYTVILDILDPFGKQAVYTEPLLRIFLSFLQTLFGDLSLGLSDHN